MADVLDIRPRVVSDNCDRLVMQLRRLLQGGFPPLSECRTTDQISIGFGMELANPGRRVPAVLGIQVHETIHVVCIEVVNPQRCDGSRCR